MLPRRTRRWVISETDAFIEIRAGFGEVVRVTGPDVGVVRVDGELVEVISLRGGPLCVGDRIRFSHGSGIALYADPVAPANGVVLRSFGAVPTLGGLLEAVLGQS